VLNVPGARGVGRWSLILIAVLACAPASCGGGSATPDGGDPKRCQNSLECPSNKVCDRAIGMCVACVTAADCPADNECTARHCVPITPCATSLECPQNQVCDTAAGRCVACLGDADCVDVTMKCVAKSCRTECVSDRTCAPLGLLCDPASGSCVLCVGQTDCPSGQVCRANSCENAICPPDQTTCVLNAVATCDATGSGYVGEMTPCDPQVCLASASGAYCADAPADGGAADLSFY
jgi:hypothetical protein